MPGPSPHWPIPLHSPPEVMMAGRGVHGSQPVERYQLPGLWCVHFYEYNSDIFIDGRHLCVHPRTVSVLPPAAIVEYHFGQPRCEHTFAHFRLPGAPAGMRLPTIPATRDLGRRFALLQNQFAEVLDWFRDQPGRASARLWDVLWQLTDAPNEVATDHDEVGFHPALDDAVRFIHLNIGSRLRVADIAKAVGISNNQLTRLFRQRFNTTAVAFIRARRIERARHLLEHSTLPINAVAREVGLADLQQFNKTIRRELGISPSEVREGKAPWKGHRIPVK